MASARLSAHRCTRSKAQSAGLGSILDPDALRMSGWMSCST